MHKIAIYSLKLSLALFMVSVFTFTLFSGVVFAYTADYDGNTINLVFDKSDLQDYPDFLDNLGFEPNFYCLYYEFDNSGGGTSGNLVPLLNTNNSINATAIYNEFDTTLYAEVLLSENSGACGGTGSGPTGVDFNSPFPIYNNNAPSNMFGSGGLLGTSTNLLASVAAGVGETGTNLWPLFVFLGVALAFIIAGKVRDFIMEMGKKERSKNDYINDLSNSKNQQKTFDILDKKDRGGYN